MSYFGHYIGALYKTFVMLFLQFRIERKWRYLNKNNYTIIANKLHDPLFPIDKVTVGDYTYGRIRVIPFSKEDGYLNIGKFCSIASGATFLLGGEHCYKTFLTYPFEGMFEHNFNSPSKGDINIGNDVWIGWDATILSGVTIGNGAIISAGSLVVKDVPPFAIVGGVPAKVLKYRFDDKIRERLFEIDYNLLSKEKLLTNRNLFLENIDIINVDELIRYINT